GLGAAFATGLTACHKNEAGEPGVIRLGYLPNVTHSPLVVGVASGRIAKAIAPLKLETKVFRAGPAVVEALLSRSIDLGSSGPAPVVITQARYGEGTLEIESGCASGGASLVLKKGLTIRSGAELRGKSLASAQLGSTQDVSLRKYLRASGLDSIENGGDVRVFAFANATILEELREGQLDGAWIPEPWPTRVIAQVGATRFLDERDLWPNHRFSSSLVVSRPAFRQARETDLEVVVAAIKNEIELAKKDPEGTRDAAFAAIDKLTGAGPKKIFDEAWKRVEFDQDQLRDAVLSFANDAKSLGLVPTVPSASLFV
ncbi:MAG TPA: ABC transporter substrate-binding protein, partial [Polyangiaceae bacterium]